MDRVNNILVNPSFIEKMTQIDDKELDRIYCKHGIAHAIDVAKIMVKKAKELGESLPIDVLYATALLHDIGRADEGEKQDHAALSARFASGILQKSGYNATESQDIVLAIMGHRVESTSSPLAEILYFADKKSRACYECAAADACKWDESRRNKSSY